MSQLASNIAHIKKIFGSQNVGVIMGMSDVQYSWYYGDNFFGTSSTHAPLVDNNTAVALTASHTALHYSEQQKYDRTTNRRTRKLRVMMHLVFQWVLNS